MSLCSLIEKPCLLLVLGCFCLGQSPLRSLVIFSGCRRREGILGVHHLQAWGETLEGVGFHLSHALLVFPCQGGASAAISDSIAFQALADKGMVQEKFPEAAHGCEAPLSSFKYP